MLQKRPNLAVSPQFEYAIKVRTLIAVFICLVIFPCSARAQDGTDYKASFLGWSPDSREFAYILTRYRQKKAPKSFSYMKKISPKRRRAVGRFFKGSVRSRAVQRGFQIHSLPVQKISAYEHRFDVGKGRTLRVVLNVGRR
ncbi:MAG TPA: hypothetical protein EYN66_22745, partial [Myxococcales bacterium]|nr:hypothetical protein [Myxococcales bacterium]